MGCIPVYILYLIAGKDSEVIGLFTSLDRAVDQLIKSAGYTEDFSSKQLLRYGRSCNFPNIKTIHNHLKEQLEFYDFNIIYRIEQQFLELDL